MLQPSIAASASAAGMGNGDRTEGASFIWQQDLYMWKAKKDSITAKFSER